MVDHGRQEAWAVDQLPCATRTEPYSLRIPRAPAIYLEPPSNRLNAYSFGSPARDDGLSVGLPVHNPDRALNVDFLADPALRILPPPPPHAADGGPGGGWTYELRRTAQQLLPFLLLGPLSCARDAAFLRGNGITLIVAVHPPNGALLVAAAARAAAAAGVELRCVEVDGREGLVPAFPTTTRAINAHLAARGPAGRPRVVLACESGNVQAAAVAAAYMMETFEGVDESRAVHVCMARRFACSFDDALVAALHTYGEIIHARRQVDQSAAGTDHLGVKRGRDPSLHSVSDAAFQDTERFVGRVHRPFV
jgi:hypothetical protein